MTAHAPIAAPAGEAATLADLMRLAALAGTRLVPPRAPLDAAVTSIVLADADAPAEAGALLVAPEPPAEVPAGCVAVLCRAAPPRGVGVPALVLPPGAAWGEVIAALASAVTGGGAQAAAARARAGLRAPLVEGRGHAGIAEAAATMLGTPVAILDEYLDVRGAHGLDAEQEAFLAEAIVRARGHGPASVMGPFVEERMPGVRRDAITGPAGPVGVLVAWLGDPLSPVERGIVTEVCEAAVMERAREEVVTATESRLRGDLIEELMAGEAVSRESIVRRARHLGADLSDGAVALIGTLQDPHTEGRLITDPRLVRRFLQQARAAIDLHWPRSLVDWNEGRLLALLPPAGRGAGGDPTREEIEAQAFTLGKRLLGATRATVPGLALTLALSRYTPEPERLGVALDESRLALSIGERLGRIGEVVTFEETGTYKLLFQIFADRPEELIAFYDQTIAPLVRYDEQYQTELVGTLSTYLGNDCNLAATASTLYTHRHTVRYRLDRIAELSGLDIGRTDDREKLSLGLKAMRLLGRRVAVPAGKAARRKAS
ncbi:PucR family transcriptional regulator [Miltoncostaea marina]|uniref:PucR family transcriptional regulator n=1 Tax=Miltoncostaea marina TaxID=2843215 RepID=UPI001C3C29E9|nr:helix-turn-helix domain-containing protein [Miltoncostaea marina]